MRGASWIGLGGALYLGALATVVAYASWGSLLQRHPTGLVAPFALLAPCAGVVASALLLGESFGPSRLADMAMIVAGLAVSVLPAGALRLAERGPMR